ncbi:MAG TPA: biopolymer transporter Tol, partial [Xanthomonadaceae bacterium]|nr:biopolymer transporter Tol [Xanthomonadaceae bacterium]
MNSTLNESSLPARLRVGGCVIDLASREIRAPGARRAARLTPKAMAVLQALVRQPGQVIAREQLLAEVWPDTLPTNDVVTQAVTQLRKALAEPGKEGGVVIETIAKTGYRLLAPVVWEQDPGSQRQAAQEPATGPAPLLPERAEQAMVPAVPPA